MKNWENGVNLAITVCDAEGKVLEMNDKSAATFAKRGGRELVGRNLLDLHPEPARSKLKKMLAEHFTNAYTIEKGGVRKLIYQTPWYEDGKFSGFVELSMEIPPEMPHHVREP